MAEQNRVIMVRAAPATGKPQVMMMRVPTDAPKASKVKMMQAPATAVPQVKMWRVSSAAPVSELFTSGRGNEQEAERIRAWAGRTKKNSMKISDAKSTTMKMAEMNLGGMKTRRIAVPPTATHSTAVSELFTLGRRNYQEAERVKAGAGTMKMGSMTMGGVNSGGMKMGDMKLDGIKTRREFRREMRREMRRNMRDVERMKQARVKAQEKARIQEEKVL